MLDPTEQFVFDRYAELSDSLAKIVAELAGLRPFMTNHHMMLARKPAVIHQTNGITIPTQQINGVRHDVTRIDPVVLDSVKAARVVIGAANKPVMLDDLYEAVKSRGFHVGTHNPKITYGARLRDHSKRVGIIALRGHGWWLRERPYVPAKYSPVTSTRHALHAAG